MQNLVNIFPDWLLIGTALLVGFVALWGVLDKSLRDRNKEKTSLEDKVRALYQEESKQLQEQVTVLSEQVKKLTTENEVITKIFQGRDSQTLEFQKQGFEVMKQFAQTANTISETHQLAVKNHNGLREMTKNIERLFKIMEKHLATEAQMASKLSIPSGAEITVKKTG